MWDASITLTSQLPPMDVIFLVMLSLLWTTFVSFCCVCYDSKGMCLFLLLLSTIFFIEFIKRLLLYTRIYVTTIFQIFNLSYSWGYICQCSIYCVTKSLIPIHFISIQLSNCNLFHKSNNKNRSNVQLLLIISSISTCWLVAITLLERKIGSIALYPEL